jgi:rod shape-determining protein MreB
MKVKGRDLVTGLPKTISINSDEVMQALKNNIEKLIENTKLVLEETPPELSADIMENGILVTGGGSLIRGIDKLFSERLGVPVRISANPLTSVAEGTGIMLDNIRLLERY